MVVPLSYNGYGELHHCELHHGELHHGVSLWWQYTVAWHISMMAPWCITIAAPLHHIATIRRPWPLIPGAATTVSHTGSEDSLVFLLPTSTASSLAFAPQQLGGMHTGVTLKQQTNRLM